MYRTGSVGGGLLTLLVVAWLAASQRESSKRGPASGDSARKRQPLSAGSLTAGGPVRLPDAAPARRRKRTRAPFQVRARNAGAASTVSVVAPARRSSRPDHADVPVAPPS